MIINEDIKLPFYVKVSILIIGLIALFAILYIAQSIIVPLVFATIIAIVLHPAVNYFVELKINRVLVIIVILSLTILTLVAFAGFLVNQAGKFSETSPVLTDKYNSLVNQLTSWASGYFDIKPEKIQEWFTKTQGELISNSTAAIGKTLATLGSVVVVLFLVPVYIFLLLFYEPLLLDFIHKLFQENHQSKVSKIISQIKTVIQQYLVGLLIEAVIVAILDAAVLLILGIDYAILLAIIASLLNVIPYIGGLIAVALPMIVALATKSSGWYAFYVLVGYYIIQLIDNNYIVPKIVASKVKINALFAIIVVIAGNALWGIPGMFLSIPLLAVVKLIFDQIDPLKPWGFLLGDTMPPILIIPPLIKIKPIFKKPDKKSK